MTASSSSTSSTGLLGRSAAALRLGGRTVQASKRKETLAAYTFLAPGFLLFSLVVLYPIARAFQISLYHWSIVPGTASQYIGLGNYGHALHDPIFWRALANTGAYMVFTVPA